MTALLEVVQLTRRFGGVTAVDAVSMYVAQGETVGLIGPNGAGKTTLFNCITGVLRPHAGDIRFGRTAPHSLLTRAPHQIAHEGLARTFQNIRLFGRATVLENVLVGTHARHHVGWLGDLLWSARSRREERRAMEQAMAQLAFVGLTERCHELASTLPFGLQRRLEMARALATEPALLLLDEPAAGLNPVEKQQLLQVLGQLKDRGMTILLIEHDMQVVMPVSDRVVVLDYGKKIAEGSPQVIQADPRVIEAYLGGVPPTV